MKPRRFTPLRTLATVLVASATLVLGGCDGDTVARTDFGEARSAAGASALPRFAELRDVRHTGTRKVELYDRSVEPARYLAYREEVASDGEGRFALTPLEPLTRVAQGWPTFQLIQRSRARLHVRYRDFAVRDEALLLRNYAIRDLDRVEIVAGRSASLFRVQRIDGSRAFELAVDDEHDLVLRARELNGQGEPLSQVTYETIDLAPVFDRVVFHRSTIDETEHGLEGLDSVFQVDVLIPRLLPQGYELRQASTLIDDQGERWAKLTFSDGVDTLFFAQALPVEGERLAAPHRLPQGDELIVSRMGSVVAAWGQVGAHRLLVLGKVDERALLDMVESALP
jgi:hypothetical protein